MKANWDEKYFTQVRCPTYNHFHNVLRLFDVLLKFLLTKIETMRDYYL